MAKISIHVQQICGLAWSADGKFLASGGNDDICCLFEAGEVLGDGPFFEAALRPLRPSSPVTTPVAAADETGSNPWNHGWRDNDRRTSATDGTEIRTVRTSAESLRTLGPGSERHCWMHGAAVKAIAFCPWTPGLVATGGGSNDKCIHFFHTTSGAALATISVSAQVTSLIWSTTRREIAATFGYSQPEHPYRIAIFSWPDCKQVAAIPWSQGLRALYAIPYPACPAYGRTASASRSSQEGCLVVAASDNSVKFHEVWPNEKKSTIGGPGTLAGSDILESLEGIDKEGEVIR